MTQGCDDYENRPVDPCHNFNCGWVIPNSPLPDWMKRNNGKVIVIFSKMTWNGVDVDLAVPVGKKIPPRSLNCPKLFSEKQRRPLIYTEQIIEQDRFQKEQQIFAHGPPAFQQYILDRQQQGKALW